MEMKNSEKSAFCQLHTIDGNWTKDPIEKYSGLTKREYFAALAMQGLLSNSEITLSLKSKIENDYIPIPDLVAKYSLEYADSLLSQL